MLFEVGEPLYLIGATYGYRVNTQSVNIQIPLRQKANENALGRSKMMNVITKIDRGVRGSI